MTTGAVKDSKQQLVQYFQQIRSERKKLDTKIATKHEAFPKEQETALKQVQDLAVKAIEGSSNVNSYQAMKEIALEQAKSQAKTK